MTRNAGSTRLAANSRILGLKFDTLECDLIARRNRLDSAYKEVDK